MGQLGKLMAGWWFGTWILFVHIGIVIPTDFHIFQRGWNHQPDGFPFGTWSTNVWFSTGPCRDLPVPGGWWGGEQSCCLRCLNMGDFHRYNDFIYYYIYIQCVYIIIYNMCRRYNCVTNNMVSLFMGWFMGYIYIHRFDIWICLETVLNLL